MEVENVKNSPSFGSKKLKVENAEKENIEKNDQKTTDDVEESPVKKKVSKKRTIVEDSEEEKLPSESHQKEEKPQRPKIVEVTGVPYKDYENLKVLSDLGFCPEKDSPQQRG